MYSHRIRDMRKIMSIFKEMHETHSFNFYEEFDALQRMLASAIARGYVKQVPVMIPCEFSPNMTWYQDIDTQEVYSLTPPNPPAREWWKQVDVRELEQSEYPTQ
jgi:hypothetical protein